MIGRAPHLQEDRLFDVYLSEHQGAPIDPPLAEHLIDCDECSRHYAELSRFLNGLRGEADAETDAIFTAERLHAQRQHIARRLELLGHAARVLSFPGHFVSRRLAAAGPRKGTRWIAAAAAAGVFVGVAAGAFFQAESRLARRSEARQAVVGVAPRLMPVATRGTEPVPDTAGDDAFLSDLDLALERPHTRELVPFDALTPHVREIRDVR